MPDSKYEWSTTFPTEPGWYFVGGTSGSGRGMIETVRIQRQKDLAGNPYLVVRPDLPHWAATAAHFGHGSVAYAKIPTPLLIDVHTTAGSPVS